jgi:hypothetical protein
LVEKLLARLTAPRALGVIGFFALLLAGMLWLSTQAYVFGFNGITKSAPAAHSGDEPHYLIVINSLLFDGDLMLQEDYARARRGGFEAGMRWRGRPLAHHTIFVDPLTREHALWLDVCEWREVDRCVPPDGSAPDPHFDERYPYREGAVEVAAHPIAFPALAAAALAPARPAIREVEGRMAIFMALIAWSGALLSYLTVRALGLSVPAAVGAAALLALASPWLAYTRSFYPATLAGVALVLALWLMLRGRILGAALSLSAAAAIKPALATVALAWILVELARRRWRSATLLSAGVAACGALLGAFNYWMAGTPLVFGAVTPPKRFNAGIEAFDTLLHPRYGVLVFAPWTLPALLQLSRVVFFRHRSSRDPMLPVAAGTLAMLAILSAFPYLGQNCYGPRYWIPLLPWLAVAAVVAAGEAGRVTRTGLAALALVGALIAIPGALFAPSLWDRPPQFVWVSLAQALRP